VGGPFRVSGESGFRVEWLGARPGGPGPSMINLATPGWLTLNFGWAGHQDRLDRRVRAGLPVWRVALVPSLAAWGG
jgi:hypothetical protein